jgi:hypothetical protein
MAGETRKWRCGFLAYAHNLQLSYQDWRRFTRPIRWRATAASSRVQLPRQPVSSLDHRLVRFGQEPNHERKDVESLGPDLELSLHRS